MKKKEWQEFHGFSDSDMERIELALSISGGKIAEIFEKPLEYQDVKITIDKSRV